MSSPENPGRAPQADGRRAESKPLELNNFREETEKLAVISPRRPLSKRRSRLEWLRHPYWEGISGLLAIAGLIVAIIAIVVSG